MHTDLILPNRLSRQPATVKSRNRAGKKSRGKSKRLLNTRNWKDKKSGHNKEQKHLNYVPYARIKYCSVATNNTTLSVQ